jgi:hypothetical protein
MLIGLASTVNTTGGDTYGSIRKFNLRIRILEHQRRILGGYSRISHTNPLQELGPGEYFLTT